MLATNAIADALFGDFGSPGNLLSLVFTEARAQEFYVDWPSIMTNSVAGFPPQLRRSPRGPAGGCRPGRTSWPPATDFADLWARHDVRGKTLSTETFRHPSVGLLTLQMQTFEVACSAPGQELVVYQGRAGVSRVRTRWHCSAVWVPATADS